MAAIFMAWQGNGEKAAIKQQQLKKQLRNTDIFIVLRKHPFNAARNGLIHLILKNEKLINAIVERESMQSIWLNITDTVFPITASFTNCCPHGKHNQGCP